MQDATTTPTGKPIKVTVHAGKPDTKPMFWQEWEEEGSGGAQKGDTIPFRAGSGSHLVTFHLKDGSGLKLRFAELPEDAIWVEIGKCPEKGGNGGQISFGPVDSNRLILKVVNSNCGVECDLWYRLNFVDENQKEWSYDPIMKNGGGGDTYF